MKKLFFTLLAGYSFQAAAQDYWTPVASGTGKNLLSVSFGNSSTGYIGGSDSLLLKTTDGGRSWKPVTTSGIRFSAISDDIVNIKFLTDKTGYLVVSNKENPVYQGGVFKTTDGGLNWTDVSQFGAYSIFFFDENNGYQAGAASFSGNNIAKLNAGSWTAHKYFNFDPSSFLYAIDFYTPAVGITGGSNGYVYRTFNAGLSWDTVKTNVDTTINALLYLDENNIIGITSNIGATIIRSNDKGATWTFDGSSATFFYPAMKAAVRSKKDSLVIAGYSVTTGKGIIYHFNPATAWMDITTADQSLNGVSMRDDSVAFIAGDSGLILTNMLSVLSIRSNSSMPEGFRVYPNPGTGIFHTATPAEHQLQVYDMTGKLLFREDRWELQHQVDLSALPKGNYLFQLLSRNNTTGSTIISIQ